MKSKLAIIGYGSIGMRHAEILKKNFVLRVFSKRKHKNKKEISFFDNINECLEGCDFAFICSNTSEHMSHINICLKKNIHIYCEKPISSNLYGINNLSKKKFFNKCQIYLGYQLRFDYLVLKAKKIIEEKKFGKLLHYRGFVGQNLTTWRQNIHYTKSNSFSKEKGGGVLLELIHDLDLIFYLLSEIKFFSGFSSRILFKNSDVEDIASINFKTKSGVVGNIFLDMVSPSHKREIQLTFEKKILNLDLVNSTISEISNKKTYKSHVVNNERNKIFLRCHNDFFKKTKLKSFTKLNNTTISHNQKLLRIINSVKSKCI